MTDQNRQDDQARRTDQTPMTDRPPMTDRTVVVTGASGHLGRLVVEALLARGVPAGRVRATARDTAALAALAARGVAVARADYDDPASLREAFAGADALVLVSSSAVGSRVPQHANAVQAAVDAGVGLLAYTSIPRADTSPLLMAVEHRATEDLLAASGLPHVLLRNGWYTENYTEQIPTYLEHGIAGAAGQGRVSTAPRADYAAAAAVVVTTDGHAGATYELGGEDFTMAELAEVVSAETGTTVTCTDVPQDAYAQILKGAGLPGPLADALADADTGIGRGDLLVTEGHLEALIGRRPTPLRDVVRAALA